MEKLTALLLQSESLILRLTESYLRSLDAYDIIIFSDVAGACEFLRTTKKVDFFFIGNRLSINGDAKELINEINRHVKTNAAVVFGTNKGLKDADWVEYLPENFPALQFVLKLQKIMPRTTTMSYLPLRLELLNFLNVFPCDVYIKISDDKLTKRFPAAEQVSPSVLAAYAAKNLEYVYISSEHEKAFFQALDASISPVPEEEKNFKRNVEDAVDYAAGVLDSLGVKMEMNYRIDEQLDDLLASIESTPGKNQKALSAAINNQSGLQAKQAAVTAIIGCELIAEKKMDSASNAKKMVMASLLQNVGLPTDGIWCLNDSSLTGLPEVERTKVLNHAKDACALLETFSDIPTDVITMIREHHGSRTGVGFLKDRHHTIFLSEIFMICSDFSTKLVENFEKNLPIDLPQMLRDQAERLGPKYVKHIQQLEDVLTGLRF
jgi:hypothetical protein